MYGFPKREHLPRRARPTPVTRFDPSGDSRCTGWWRADDGVVADANAAVASWTSRKPPYRAFTPNSGLPALYVPRLTNGFGAIVCPLNTASYSVNQLAQDGDREMTLTYVMRWPYDARYSGNTYLSMEGHQLSMGEWDNWPRPLVTGSWTSWINGWWGFPNLESVVVFTARVTVVTPVTDLRQRWYFNFNHTQGGPFDNGTGATASVTSALSIFSQYRITTFWHELIYFRSFLSDSEVASMHAALMEQYAVPA